MSSIAPSVGSIRTRGRSVVDRIGDEGLLVTVLGLFAALLAATAPYLLQPDSWLAFVGGREVANNGIPRVDSLSVLAHGRRWVDQQWLAQLVTYRLESAIGIGATLAVFSAALVLTLMLACAIARQSASPRSVAIFVVLAFPALFGALRTQTFSYVMFVPFFALLSAESRRPTRRVWIALPVLALWANFHGAVVVAAALLALLGLNDIVGRRRARGVGLVLGAAASLFATPYGVGIVRYYRSTMGNALFRSLIPEWASPSPLSYVGLPFLVTAVAAIVLVVRSRRKLTSFEVAALAVTLAGGLTAERSVIWFAFAALLLLPALLDQEWTPGRIRAPTRAFVACLAACTIGLASALAAHTVAAGGTRIDAVYPPTALNAVGNALVADPSARVLADDRTSDWLLYELPSVRGRLAFDCRWELLTAQAFRAARDYLKQSGTAPERLMHGYQVFVVDHTWHPALARRLRAMRGLREVYRGSHVDVFER